MSKPIDPTPADRLLSSVRAIIRSVFPNYDFIGLYEYAIQGVSASGIIDATPTDTTIPLPPLSGLTLRPSLVGENVVATVGTLCLVEFINADPSRPQVVSIGETIFEGTIDAIDTVNVGPSASSVELGVAASPVSRQGDAAVIYFDVATPLLITGTVYNAPSPSNPTGATTTPGMFVGTLTLESPPPAAPGTPVPCPGIVTSSSTKVFG
jgi:hypothetical protein